MLKVRHKIEVYLDFGFVLFFILRKENQKMEKLIFVEVPDLSEREAKETLHAFRKYFEEMTRSRTPSERTAIERIADRLSQDRTHDRERGFER